MKWLSDQQSNAAYVMAAQGFVDHNENCEMGLEYIYQMTLDEIEWYRMQTLEGLIDLLEEYSAAYHAPDKQHYPHAWHSMGVKLSTLKAYMSLNLEVMA